jgi:hypothetical protein
MIPGKFHWSLFITDDKGVATRLQWKENISPGIPVVQAEIYSVDKVDPVTEITEGNHMSIVFFKFCAFNPLTNFDYNAALSRIFPAGYSTINANREHNLTCRTWLLAALQILRQYRLIRLSESQIAGLEAKIISTGLEEEVRFSNQGSLFKTPVKEL